MITGRGFENEIFFTNNLWIKKIKSLISYKDKLYLKNRLRVIKQIIKL